MLMLHLTDMWLKTQQIWATVKYLTEKGEKRLFFSYFVIIV